VTDDDSLPYLEVETTPDSQRFWEELAAGRVTIPWCATCDTWVWHPRSHCPRCLTAVDGERTLSGDGVVYGFAVVHRGAEGFEQATPYVSSYVTLDGGPTVLSNVVGDDRLDTRVGDRVRFVPPERPVVIGALRFVRLPS
jgi:uncharacterized protein